MYSIVELFRCYNFPLVITQMASNVDLVAVTFDLLASNWHSLKNHTPNFLWPFILELKAPMWQTGWCRDGQSYGQSAMGYVAF